MDGLSLFDTNQGTIPFDSRTISRLLAIGKQVFVNETTGDDTNPGSSSRPFKTLTAALAAVSANDNDIIYLTGTVHVTATVAWNKDGVSLIGLASQSQNSRARISASGTMFTPMVNVTAANCRFVNIATFYGFDSDTAQVCWADAGGRNQYSGVSFLGGGHATAAANAGMRSLTIAGGTGENTFEDCIIGLDTVTRATGNNASLSFSGGSPRNIFRRCAFRMLTSNSADVHVDIPSGGIDRYALFDDCVFMNAIESTGSTIAAAITANASAGGAVVLRNPLSLGATAIATTGPVYGDAGALGATTRGIAIKLT